MVLGGAWYYLQTAQRPVACTSEAKICPDGSSVGRVGPDCAFAQCPTSGSNLLSADVYPLYNNLTWGAETATTSLSLTGYSVTSQPISNISDLSAASLPFEQYYKEKLRPLGWSVDNSLAAGGPGASIIAYKKGGQYIILSYQTTFHCSGANEPVSCPCDITFSIFSSNPVAVDYKNATYTIEGQPVTLINGRTESTTTPGSASRTTTQYFGNNATGDLNGDGVPDIAFIVTQNAGGSGTFYYVVAAVKNPEGYQGTNAVLLGDRIAPQTTEIQNGELIVNYADRKTGDPMTTAPSVGISKYLTLSGNQLTEVPAPTDTNQIDAHKDLIQVTSPLASSTITSPITITGEARGTWYFEASFPVVLVDWDGKILAQGTATAQSDWMTTNFVPFTATLTFKIADISGQYSNKGTLILKKDNPSGLPAHDDALEIPVYLK